MPKNHVHFSFHINFQYLQSLWNTFSVIFSTKCNYVFWITEVMLIKVKKKKTCLEVTSPNMKTHVHICISVYTYFRVPSVLNVLALTWWHTVYKYFSCNVYLSFPGLQLLIWVYIIVTSVLKPWKWHILACFVYFGWITKYKKFTCIAVRTILNVKILR